MSVTTVLMASAAFFVAPLRPLQQPRSQISMGWPWESKAPEQAGEAGQFMRHSDLEPGCAPLGVVCAGFDEDRLELLAQTIEDVFQGPDGVKHVPIAVVGKADLKLRLRDILAGLSERDSVLPDRPAEAAVPLVMFSGFSTTATSAAVRAIRSTGLTGGSFDRPPMMAVAVPKALDKSLSRLLEEIEGDHLANSAPPASS